MAGLTSSGSYEVMLEKRRISETQVEKLIANKKTDLIKGFKSKTGNSFDAFLIVNQEGQVTFEFKA